MTSTPEQASSPESSVSLVEDDVRALYESSVRDRMTAAGLTGRPYFVRNASAPHQYERRDIHAEWLAFLRGFRVAEGRAAATLEAAERERDEALKDGQDTLSRWIIRMAAVREASGVGHKPMLDEVPTAIAARIAELEKERDEARAANERNRATVAAGLQAIRRVIDSRDHLREPGRGPYAYDDEGYQQEFGAALDELQEALWPLKALAADWSDCPQSPEAIAEARIDWKARAARAEALLREAVKVLGRSAALLKSYGEVDREDDREFSETREALVAFLTNLNEVSAQAGRAG